MSFLAPGFLVAAGLAALAVVGLHFLSTRDPRLELLPTARFLPDVAVRATATAIRPTDLRLMLLRAAMVLVVGSALARPVITPPRQPVARIVAVDVSRAVGRPAELADSAQARLADAAAVILFDSTAREVPEGASDSLRTLADAGARAAAPRGSLSAAFIAASRAAARLRDRADSLELVVVSRFVAEERDAATSKIRALWPGRVTTVQVAATGVPERGDSIRVEWADSGATALWAARPTPDTVGAVRAGDAVLVYPFGRRWRPASAPDSLTRVLARWADGEPAALERATAGGCVRSVAFTLPTEGDALLRPEFQRFTASLGAPCGEPRELTPLPTSVMASLRGAGPLAPTAAIARRIERVTPLMPWLLGAGALLLLLESVVRRRPGRTATPLADAPRPDSAGMAA